MRAISLWQPWASAIALGVKRVETRHWSTQYRGALAIHAARRWTHEQKSFAFMEVSLGRLPNLLPLGAVVAVCRLADCVPTEDLMAGRIQYGINPVERIYGNYDPGRFGWLLEDIRPLPEPITFKGGQSFFTVPDDLFPTDFLKLSN